MAELRSATRPRANSEACLLQGRIEERLFDCVARLEALLIGAPEPSELRPVLERLDPGAGGTFTWLDPRNASLAVLPGSASLPVRVLLEMRERGELAVLVTSREGMTRGAPLSHGVLEQVLVQLQNLLPQATLQYRSDRDGPVEQPAGVR